MPTFEITMADHELEDIVKRLLGDRAGSLLRELSMREEYEKKGEVDGVWLLRRLLDLGADPEKLKSMLRFGMKLREELVVAVMAEAQKEHIETDVEFRVGAEDEREESRRGIDEESVYEELSRYE